MQTPEFKLKPLRTLGVFLACGALIAGCAGNGVKPDEHDTGPVVTSQISHEQAGSNVNDPVAQASSMDSAPTASDNADTTKQAETTTPTDNTPNIAESDTTKEQPAGQSVSASLEPAQTTFYFGVNQTSLADQDKAVLAQHASFLKANPTLILEINGHTDSTGKHAFNEYLSKQRAEAVAKVLIKDGVKRSQLVINALADSKPLSDQSDPGKNRRVELQYDDMSMVSSK